MAENEPLEIVFYVHGVSPGQDVNSHAETYKAMHEGIVDAGVAKEWPAAFGGAEWGWNFDDGEPKSHKALTVAQQQLGEPLMELLKDQRDFSFNPTRLLVNGLRPLMFFGFGDMFYYVSGDGKTAVRQAIAEQVFAHIKTQRVEVERPVSLTLLGHSAGSVVAFDFLYYLFTKRKGHTFLKSYDDDEACGMAGLRELAQSGKLRLRKLITFGSPICMVAFRSDALVEILSRGQKLRPEDYGLTSGFQTPPELSGARWINLWDKDDPIAWPIAPLMDSPLARDVYTDVSDFVGAAHNAYWKSARVHTAIAESW